MNTDDAWGSPAPPADSSTSGDPFGDGSKKDDPWGSLSSTANDETGEFGFAPTASSFHHQTLTFCPSLPPGRPQQETPFRAEGDLGGVVAEGETERLVRFWAL